MIGLIQRVTEASVAIDSVTTARIGGGLLALIGVEKLDSQQSCERLADRLLGYRVFPDHNGKMNLDVRSSGAQMLLVPQFTLVADTSKGRRPGFSTAASPEKASQLFDAMVEAVSDQIDNVQQGTFGADMKVHLINDGPVTFWIRVDPGE